MIRKTLTFEEDPDLWVVVLPAIPKLNPLYEAAAGQFVQPYALGIALGKYTERDQALMLAKCYAHAVMVGGCRDMPSWKPRQWIDWLMADLDRFARLRATCEYARTFVPDAPPDPLDDAAAEEDHDVPSPPGSPA